MKTRHTQDERDILSMKGTCLLRLMRTEPLAPHANLRNTSCTAPTRCSMHCVPLVPTPQHLVDVDDVADVLVLVIGGVDGLRATQLVSASCDIGRPCKPPSPATREPHNKSEQPGHKRNERGTSVMCQLTGESSRSS